MYQRQVDKLEEKLFFLFTLTRTLMVNEAALREENEHLTEERASVHKLFRMMVGLIRVRVKNGMRKTSGLVSISLKKIARGIRIDKMNLGKEPKLA